MIAKRESVLQPRNDWVLVKQSVLDATDSGIALPQVSVDGKQFHIVAVGPKVEQLEPGDKVLMVGRQNVDYFPLPRSNELFMIKEEYVVLVLKD